MGPAPLPRCPPWLLTLTLCGACNTTPGPFSGVVVHVQPEDEAVFAPFVDLIQDDRVSLAASRSPTTDAEEGAKDQIHIVAARADTCTDCYWMVPDAHGRVVVFGDAPLGLQYGVAHALETLDYRFHHPFDPVRPGDLAWDAGAFETGLQSPELETRGLHLHTLHPIEGLVGVWTPHEDGTARAEAIIDFVVKNRGNYLQWVSLDDITNNPTRAEEWTEHTSAIVEHAHMRGIETGVGVQLFGASNLQQAFDLIDDEDNPGTWQESVSTRLDLLMAPGFDRLNLSFGEFFGADPDLFISGVNLAFDEARLRDPGIEMSTVIHVGDSEEQKVVYEDQEVIYYFLVQWADEEIVPWIHTVMYYNLFDDAGGAYHHEEFDAHRAYLFDRMEARQPVGYFPETAYWVAFDVSVPVYLPVYMQSRWSDLDRIARGGRTGATDRLKEHVVFSSGWEWGYWANDVISLRMTYSREADWQTHLAQMWSPWGETGAAMAQGIGTLADVQRHYLIEQRLAPYYAGRDAVLDVGFDAGVVAQPERPRFADVAAYSTEQAAEFETDVVDELTELAEWTERVAPKPVMPGQNLGDAWLKEVDDGVQISALRARYTAALWGAVAQHAQGQDPSLLLAQADAHFAAAEVVVARRHSALHDPLGDTLTGPDANPTIYQYGYLHQADSLCYWERERIQASNAITGDSDPTPPCI